MQKSTIIKNTDKGFGSEKPSHTDGVDHILIYRRLWLLTGRLIYSVITLQRKSSNAVQGPGLCLLQNWLITTNRQAYQKPTITNICGQHRPVQRQRWWVSLLAVICCNYGDQLKKPITIVIAYSNHNKDDQSRNVKCPIFGSCTGLIKPMSLLNPA